jgi:hypothetical protein
VISVLAPPPLVHVRVDVSPTYIKMDKRRRCMPCQETRGLPPKRTFVGDISAERAERGTRRYHTVGCTRRCNGACPHTVREESVRYHRIQSRAKEYMPVYSAYYAHLVPSCLIHVHAGLHSEIQGSCCRRVVRFDLYSSHSLTRSNYGTHGPQFVVCN